MNIQITKITCVRYHTGDILYFDTTLPEGIWPFEKTAYLKMEVAANTAERYCEKNFPGVLLEVKCGGY